MRRLAAIFFLVSVALATATLALAQNSGKAWRLGVLTLPTSANSPVFETFRSAVFPELAKQGCSAYPKSVQLSAGRERLHDFGHERVPFSP